MTGDVECNAVLAVLEIADCCEYAVTFCDGCICVIYHQGLLVLMDS